MDGIEKAFSLLIFAVVAVLVINLLLNVNYSSYAQSRNNLVTNYGVNSGVVANYTTVAGGINTTVGSNLGYVIGLLFLIIVIVALLWGIRSGRLGSVMGGNSG